MKLKNGQYVGKIDFVEFSRRSLNKALMTRGEKNEKGVGVWGASCQGREWSGLK